MILAVLGIGLYIAISYFHISLWFVLLAGTMLGVVFGKVFCRWVCPMELIMEPAKFSLYKPAMEKPGISYTCSKCLECVAACPNGSLTYKI